MLRLFTRGAILAVAFLFITTPFITQAALSVPQVQSVLELLNSFGVSESVTQNVSLSLQGVVLGQTTVADDYGIGSVPPPDAYPPYCPKLSITMQRGARDAATRGQVSELQRFLSGYYNIDPSEIVTGYFGSVTQKFVIQLQKEQGLPSFGIVGTLTRAVIARVCGGTTTTTTTIPSIIPPQICPAIAWVPIECANGTLKPTYGANGCQNGWQCLDATSALFSAYPTSGAAPLYVTFTGDTGAGCGGGYFTLYYGDGQSELIAIPADSCKDTFTKTHTYTAPGTFTASLGAKGGTRTISIVVSSTTSTVGAVSVSLDASSPSYKLVAAGSTDVLTGAFKFRATGENVNLYKLVIIASAFPSDVTKVSVYDGATKVGEGYFIGGAGSAPVNFTQTVLLPRDTDKVLTVKADFANIGNGQIVTHSGDFIRLNYGGAWGTGSSSGSTISPSGSATVAGVRLVRSFPTVGLGSLSTSGIEDGRLTRIKVAADSHGPISIGRVRVVTTASGVSLSNVTMYGFEDSNYSLPVSGFGSGGLLATRTSLNTFEFPRPLFVPAGSVRYLEVRASVTGASTGSFVTTRLVGDGNFPGSDGSLLTMAAFAPEKDWGFIWSPNSTTTSQFGDVDWTNGYGIPGLPSGGLVFTRGGTGTTLTQCSDGVDNDGNGLIDYPSDPGCASLTDTTEASSSTPTITVTAPNGSEQWEIGQLNTITWSPYGYNPDVNPSNQVTVYLLKSDGSTVGRVMDTGKASLHTYFNLNDYQTWAAPGQYRVYLKNATTGKSDQSDWLFTLLPRGVDIKVNGSDGPVTLSDNQPVTVTFTMGATFSTCMLNGVRETVNGGPGVEFGNKYPIGSTFNGYAYAPVPGSSTAIYVTCTKPDGSTRGDSVQVNMIGGLASVRVISPNGGESIDPTKQWDIKTLITGLKTLSFALYKNDQWYYWLAKDLPASGRPDNFEWVHTHNPIAENLPELKDGSSAVFKIYATGLKADNSGYVDDKSDSPFSFVKTTTSLPAVPSYWKLYSFSTYGTPSCSGPRYVGYSQRYGGWVGAVLCGTNTKYKLYMSVSETGTYYQIADYAGHGQDHCELVNASFAIPNEDDITSGGCTSCSVGSLVDVQNEPVFARSRFGEAFKQVTSVFWADLSTSYYMCGVPVGFVLSEPQPYLQPQPSGGGGLQIP